MTSQGVPHPELNGYQQIIVWCARGAKGLGVFVPRPANGTRGSGEGLDHPWTTPPRLKVKLEKPEPRRTGSNRTRWIGGAQQVGRSSLDFKEKEGAKGAAPKTRDDEKKREKSLLGEVRMQLCNSYFSEFSNSRSSVALDPGWMLCTRPTPCRLAKEACVMCRRLSADGPTCDRWESTIKNNV